MVRVAEVTYLEADGTIQTADLEATGVADARKELREIYRYLMENGLIVKTDPKRPRVIPGHRILCVTATS